MPNVTRRNQVLKELDRCQQEFLVMSLPPLPAITVIPDAVNEIIVQYNFPWHVRQAIDVHFTKHIQRVAAPDKPAFVTPMNQLRDKATLASNEQDVTDIFEQVALIRQELIEWQAPGNA